jgi:hypothetical protein
MPLKPCVVSTREHENCLSAPGRPSRMACWSGFEIQARAWRRRSLSGFLTPSARQSRAVWGWASRSAARSSMPMAGDCGQAGMKHKARSFSLRYLLGRHDAPMVWFRVLSGLGPAQRDPKRRTRVPTRIGSCVIRRCPQNRKRNPTVGATEARLRKPFARPPLTCDHITPA